MSYTYTLNPEYNNPKSFKDDDFGEEPTMNINHTICALQDFTTVRVHFADGGKRYTYKTNEKFEVGDAAIIEAPNGGGLKICHVSEVHDTPQIDFGSAITYKWIVQRVDTTGYKAMLENEKAIAVQLRQGIANKKRKEVKKDLIEQLGLDNVSELEKLLISKD